MISLKKNRQGFSLVEVMVAMVIVATIAIVSARSFVSMKRSEVGLREADMCKSYLDSAFKSVDTYGMMPTLIDTTTIAHTASASGTSSLAPSGQSIKSVAATAAFPLHSQALVTFQNSNQLTLFTTPSMLGGTITMLNGLYNDHSTNCTTSITDGASGLLPAAPVGATGFTTTLKMNPYSLSTGADQTNCSTLKAATGAILAPKGMKVTGTESAVSNNGTNNGANADLAQNVLNDIGFHVNLAVSFMTPDGHTHSCNATHNYSYMADLAAPLAPDVHTITYSNLGSEAPTYGPHQVILNIGYSVTPAKPGAILMCEDLSTANHDPGDSIFGAYGNPYITAFHPPLGHKFAPCEWVTLCGKSQRVGTNSRATFDASAGTYKKFSMQSIWPNNGVNGNGNTIPPYGCNPLIGIIAVDMAGNTSTEVTTDPVPVFGALQDCAGGWSACTGPCGVNAGTHTWHDTREAQYGGSTTTCAAAEGATQACTASICPVVNCSGSYSACIANGSPTCGPGSGHENFIVTIPASGGGTACPASPISCSVGSCPPNVDCVGGWSTCTSACGTSCQETYSISVAQSGTGVSCPAASGATRMFAMPACSATPTPTPAPTPSPTPATCDWSCTLTLSGTVPGVATQTCTSPTAPTTWCSNIYGISASPVNPMVDPPGFSYAMGSYSCPVSGAQTAPRPFNNCAITGPSTSHCDCSGAGPTPTPTPPILCYQKSIGFGPVNGCDNALSFYSTLAQCTADPGAAGPCNHSPFTGNCVAVHPADSTAVDCPPAATPTPNPLTNGCYINLIPSAGSTACTSTTLNVAGTAVELQCGTAIGGLGGSAGYFECNSTVTGTTHFCAPTSCDTNGNKGTATCYCPSTCSGSAPQVGAQCCSGVWKTPPYGEPGGWYHCGCGNSPEWSLKCQGGLSGGCSAPGYPLANGC